MQPLIIEARVNEYASRRRNPHVPWTPDEIARDASACREAGASIVHFHARHTNGARSHDLHHYADALARIHDASDILVHPTLGAFHRGRIATPTRGARDDDGSRPAHSTRLLPDGHGEHERGLV